MRDDTSIKVIFLLFYISAAHFVILQTVITATCLGYRRNFGSNQMWYLKLEYYCHLCVVHSYLLLDIIVS